MEVPTTSAVPSGSAVAVSISKSPKGAIRSACDRCHSQKLRCVKKTKQLNCERCSKLRKTCIFSPRVPRTTQKSRQQDEMCNTTELLSIIRSPNGSEADKHSILNPFLEQIDSLTPDFQYLIGDASFVEHSLDWSGILDQSSELSFINLDVPSDVAALWPTNQTASNEILNTYPKLDEDNSSIVRKAADLNVALHQCVSSFPTIVDSNRQRATLLVFEEVFTLTNTFFDILRSLSFRASYGHSQYLTTPSLIAMDQHTPFSHVDEATILLLASCHSHLVSIFDSVFQRIQGCLKHSLRPHPGEDWVVVLPKLQIGTVEMPAAIIDVNTPAPPHAATSMYMFKITLLSSQFWEQLRGIIGQKTNNLHSSPTLKDTVWDTVVGRTEEMLRTIYDTKLLLQHQAS